MVKRVLPLILAGFTAVLLFFVLSTTFEKENLSLYEQSLIAQKEKIETYREHFEEGSTQYIRYTEKLNKIERRLNGYAKADKPDEFARILAEMKTAPDEEAPS